MMEKELNFENSAYAQKAMELHRGGYNCAQAVLLAFADRCGLDPKTAALLAGPLGGGFGGQREVCGTVSAMSVALGALYGYADPKETSKKAALYKLVKECSAEFSAVTGSIVCRELLGLDQDGKPQPLGAAKPGKPPCRTLVGLSASILERHLPESTEKAE